MIKWPHYETITYVRTNLDDMYILRLAPDTEWASYKCTMSLQPSL